MFTPAELVEERVYLVLPPEAKDWAVQAGVPIPPETFDVILSDSELSEGARIDSPAMFAYVGGEVQIKGSAEGDGFERYRLQAGSGLFPQKWLQVGEDKSTPVDGNLLAVWDTRGLSGLYTLQLVVIRQDQSVQTDVVQVTVDNRLPEVTLISPVEGQDIAAGEALLQADVRDDLALDHVEFYLDDRLIKSMIQPPFTLIWEAKPGEHVFRVKASDQAGNSSQAEVNFLVK